MKRIPDGTKVTVTRGAGVPLPCVVSRCAIDPFGVPERYHVYIQDTGWPSFWVRAERLHQENPDKVETT